MNYEKVSKTEGFILSFNSLPMVQCLIYAELSPKALLGSAVTDHTLSWLMTSMPETPCPQGTLGCYQVGGLSDEGWKGRRKSSNPFKGEHQQGLVIGWICGMLEKGVSGSDAWGAEGPLPGWDWSRSSVEPGEALHLGHG